MKSILRWLPLCLMCAAVLAAGAFLLFGRHSITADMILSYTPRRPLLAALVLISFFALKSITVFVPYDALVIAGGILFKLPFALLVNFTGTAVCILIPYFVGRASQGALLARVLSTSEALTRFYASQRRYSFGYSYVLRTLSLPNDLLGLFFGSLEMPCAPFLLSSLLGICPGMVVFTVLGSALDPTSPLFLTCLAIDLVIIAATLLLYRRHMTAEKT